MMRAFAPASFALAPLMLLAACGSDPEPTGGVTPAEDQALNDAAEMLDNQSLVDFNRTETEE